MLVRLIIWIALGGVGFAGGMLCFRGGDPAPGVDNQKSLASWSTTQPTALVSGGGSTPSGAIEAVRRTHSDNLGAAMLDYLRVVAETPLDGLTALLVESEKSLPQTDIGGVGLLMREAIVERLMAEDPDQLLRLLITGQSDHLSKKIGMGRGSAIPKAIMNQLREQMGYDAIKAALAETQYPLGAARAMQAMWNDMANDPELNMEQVLEDDRPDSNLLWGMADTEERVELSLADKTLHGHTITNAFMTYYAEQPEKALSKLETISSSMDRRMAVAGIGHGWNRGDTAGAQEFAKGLGSNQMRVAFLSNALEVQNSGNSPAGTLNNIVQLDPGTPRVLLLEQELRQWKLRSREAARRWAEENEQLALFERLITPPSPVSLNAIDVLQLGSDYIFTPPPGGDE